MMKQANLINDTDKVIFHCGKGGAKKVVHTYTDTMTNETTINFVDGTYTVQQATDMLFVK